MSHEKNQSVIDALNNCTTACNHCTTSCLDEQDIQKLSKCIKLNIDCAQVCSLTASLLARGSDHGKYLINECVEICNACAEECEKHSHMEHCKNCAEACRQCATECSNTL